MAKKTDLTKHTKEELMKLANEKREELRVLRFGVAGSKNRNTKAARNIRKDIARALTAANKPATN